VLVDRKGQNERRGTQIYKSDADSSRTRNAGTHQRDGAPGRISGRRPTPVQRTARFSRSSSPTGRERKFPAQIDNLPVEYQDATASARSITRCSVQSLPVAGMRALVSAHSHQDIGRGNYHRRPDTDLEDIDLLVAGQWARRLRAGDGKKPGDSDTE